MTAEEQFLDDDPSLNHTTGPNSKIEIEAYLHIETESDFFISMEESGKLIVLDRTGVEIAYKRDNLVTLSLSESKAIEYNLV